MITSSSPLIPQLSRITVYASSELLRVEGFDTYFFQDKEQLITASPTFIGVIDLRTMEVIAHINFEVENPDDIPYLKLLEVEGQLFLLIFDNGLKLFKINLDPILSISLEYEKSWEEWNKNNLSWPVSRFEGYLYTYTNGTIITFLTWNYTFINFDVKTKTIKESKRAIAEEYTKIDYLASNNNNTLAFLSNIYWNDTLIVFYNFKEQKTAYIYNASQLFSGEDAWRISYSPSLDVFIVSSWYRDMLAVFSSNGSYLYTLAFPEISEDLRAFIVAPKNCNCSWWLICAKDYYYRYYYNNKTVKPLCGHDSGVPINIYWLPSYQKYLFYGPYALFLYDEENHQKEYFYMTSSASDNKSLGEYWYLILIGLLGPTFLFTITFLYLVKRKK